ncbi:uncharacterized protein MYCGRDRAFT_103434 [Zymoseptoria tritici IPO323]|uniref:Uncharacterized protein n=1 Tax=Zymoseptoria tritici (strain CBS 115943 / IPO323) TaxID=336722 RepID=F9X3A1_ZYMTI|nr:uncharacterized protein MYCGRDRAFT_103434 [Zymoseptoria tritici IPO323]EGP90130.1 hypothetical protein MYCGRDRAFT_103434 [Zymoseptoria tritici IPO323]
MDLSLDTDEAWRRRNNVQFILFEIDIARIQTTALSGKRCGKRIDSIGSHRW